MDSLYINVIHSTTDLQGGLRKARDLARPAGYAGAAGGDHGEQQQDHDDHGSSWYYDDDNSRDSRGGRGDGGDGGSQGREEGEDDEDLTHKDVIFFPYGAVVFWGCSEDEVRRWHYPIQAVEV